MVPEIVGADSGMAPVLDAVRRAASADVNVLLRGETGTGKELVARALHAHSPRRTSPFVVADCAVIPDELMESAFFGHVRGAFTGAICDHVGYFESAGAGTVLLDEVGDLHLNLQAKILRVVEERTFRRVGSARVLRAFARVVAATNQPLEELVADRRFRQDLYFRLDVITIHVPPLRARRQDIPAFVHHFLRTSRGRTDEPPPRITPRAFAILTSHDWPGNVRELRNVVERLVLRDASVIDAADVEQVMHADARPPDDELVRPLREVERRAIERALVAFGGNRTKAAEALGIGRRTLQTKIRLFGLDGRERDA